MVLLLQSKETEKNNLILEEILSWMINLVNLNLNYVVIKQAKSLLSKCLVEYSRTKCIEVVSIRDSVNNSELEDKVLTVFQKVGCELSPQNLEASHSLAKTDFLIHEKWFVMIAIPHGSIAKLKVWSWIKILLRISISKITVIFSYFEDFRAFRIS